MTTPDNNPQTQGFTQEQQQYLAGFLAGSGLAQSVAGTNVPVDTTAGTTANNVPGSGGGDGGGGGGGVRDYILAEQAHLEAQDRVLDAGGKLPKEEKAKRRANPLDLWPDMLDRADRDQPPKGIDVFLAKYHGLFYVAPAQDSFMCRLRIPAGRLSTHQFRGIADVAENYGGPYTHVTTRANLQVREIPPRHAPRLVEDLQDVGIVTRGSGADNIRNITASPTAGFDPQELIDTTALARRMHHYILGHREMYGLPRKFNIAFDGGGTISALADTNDIGFAAVRLDPSNATDSFPPGVYFRLQLGGITGHKDFARDTGVMFHPDDCVRVAAAIVRVFIAHGDRTDRNKARLKYLLDAWGFDTFLQAVEKDLDAPLPRFPIESCEQPKPPRPDAHIGVHPQAEADRYYVGVALPVGRLSVEQMRQLADIADRFGEGDLRLTVWQNLLIPHVHEHDLPALKSALDEAGLTCSATSVRAGLVACTGNTGCRFAAADTKGHALQIADHLESRIGLDTPVNIHLTGCHHSCAQHYIGDVGLIATSVERGDDTVEGYHVFVGGGYGEHADIGRELMTSIPHDELPAELEHLFRLYLDRREADETFRDFARRHDAAELQRMLADHRPQSPATQQA